MPKDILDGCRPDQLVGVWSFEPTAFETLYARAMAVLESDARYEVVSRESREMAEEQRDNPYQVDASGTAHFDVSGPLTRRPTSMQSITGGTSTLLLGRALDKAGADPNVKRAMLHVDSPGGHSAVQADLRAAMGRFRATGKPLGGHATGSGCSAAYGLLAECDTITADPAAVVGSVGTMMVLRDTSEVMKRAGVRTIYVATGDRKAAGAPGTPISDETIQDVSKVIADAGADFRDRVRERRPNITPENMTDILRGGVYAGSAAKSIGLVDEVCDTHAAIERFSALSTGSSSGSALPPAIPTAGAPQIRSRTMLTPEQLTQAKSLPGCADITAENADGKLLAAATALATDKLTATTRVSQLESDLAQAKSQVAAPLPQPVLMAMASAARTQMRSAIDKQAVSPAVAESLAKSLIGEGDALNAAALAPTATGDSLASVVFSALASNGAAPAVGKDAGGQPAPKATPGAPADQEVKPERLTSLLSATPLGQSILAINGKN